MQEAHYDAIVIGAGLGGLLSAAQLLQRGKSVALLERLDHCGGRFTAKTFKGVQVSTGAVHMVPFGSSGVLARTLRRLQIPHRLLDADVFGSFHVHGRQVRARGLLGVYRFLGPRQFFWFLRLGYLMFFRPLPASEGDLPFSAWLARHINVERNRELVAFFERIARFALSLELHQVSTAEVIATTKNMFRYGAPGIVEGGCGALVAELERRLRERGAAVLLSHEVLQILHADGRVTGVRARNKATGDELLLSAPLVVSDIGPRATTALVENRQVRQAELLKQQREAAQTAAAASEAPHAYREAVGLKVHVLSDVSLIPHRGIMYCLDTQRIAGIVQPTNCDPRLAPPGKHLLITHQVLQSENIEEEKALAIADLRRLFGETFERHCRILTMSVYRGEWPVNRLAQGRDLSPVTPLQGLFLVGDAVKPSGYLMVEGVAQSVNYVLDLLDAIERGEAAGPLGSPHLPATTAADSEGQRRPGWLPFGRGRKRARSGHVVRPPSRLNALRWLWTAPGNARKQVRRPLYP
ncbi:MAG: NAD(P)/FAD-dependent oxidoreductase [Thermogemmatispora sp.]|uniref:phytoene desaturase family protein n=1 Tax=Thermogemmatispora sp. TaxID=1968838 RepID=UPI00262B4E32|nr:NAD(P)/FAD-dependent oxidoreductase [Thermogemmatispora sp.]MBX5458409.1 NAD(P)/FAD-dependent oxidoreductase [Thermogemmatispora sp.]